MNQSTNNQRPERLEVEYTPWKGGAIGPRPPDLGGLDRDDKLHRDALIDRLRVAWPALSDDARHAIGDVVTDDLGPELAEKFEAVTARYRNDLHAWARRGAEGRARAVARAAEEAEAMADVPWSTAEGLARDAWEQSGGEGRRDLREFFELVLRQAKRGDS